jgi:HK97 family phage prohead protease
MKSNNAKEDNVGEDRSTMKKIERRTFTVRNIETRQEGDGTMRLAGYAAVFNDPSVPLPFSERIAPGAFRKTLSETPDVRLLINHEGLPLARTKNNTLTLTEDETGLYIDALLPDTSEARDLWTLVQRGDVDQMSFAFRVIRQSWNKDRTERTLTEVSLADGDVSVVTYPAYPTTTVEARAHLQNAMEALKEGRALEGEALIAVQAIFDKISESADYLEEGKSMMEVMLGLDTLVPAVEVEDPEVELTPASEIDPMMAAGRSISLRLAQAIVNNTK